MSSLDVRAIDKSDLKKKARPAVAQELTVFIAEAAFDRAVERGSKDTTREIGGVLVGEVLVTTTAGRTCRSSTRSTRSTPTRRAPS
jgi:hypothetical protein